MKCAYCGEAVEKDWRIQDGEYYHQDHLDCLFAKDQRIAALEAELAALRASIAAENAMESTAYRAVMDENAKLRAELPGPFDVVVTVPELMYGQCVSECRLMPACEWKQKEYFPGPSCPRYQGGKG